MKRAVAVIGFLLLAGTGAVAQAQGGGLAIKGGLSYGNVSNGGTLPGSVTQRSGFAIGLSANTGGMLGLGIEGMYAQRGFDNSTAADARHLDYIDVPVYVRVAIPTGSIAPFAYAGPQGSYELNCGASSGNCPDSGRPKVTYSGVIGAGLAFNVLHGMTVEYRYVYGLTDLKLSTVSTTESYKTRSSLLLVGFGF
ncbi:MAG TPA: porin family protein [Gemmatimonadaceae bacterium]|nr:porin family protein [Gemmatimonadaceae bacterium]